MNGVLNEATVGALNQPGGGIGDFGFAMAPGEVTFMTGSRSCREVGG
jgi:hypothetical protein